MIVYTTSYEGRSMADFLAGLTDAEVRIVADVRENPISRKPGFSRTALSAALEGEGISYRHIRALGCPRHIRNAYREDGDWARYTADFMEHLAGQQAAVDALASTCAKAATALLCYEADFTRCHRTFVARAVADKTGARVCHMTSSGLVEYLGESSSARTGRVVDELAAESIA